MGYKDIPGMEVPPLKVYDSVGLSVLNNDCMTTPFYSWSGIVNAPVLSSDFSLGN